MFLKQKTEGHLLEVLDLVELQNPMHDTVAGRLHYGEEMQDPEPFAKTTLCFPSGEALPRCWIDPHFRDHEIRGHLPWSREGASKK